MAHGDLIWCDLSAYDPAVARGFYSALLGWQWTTDGDTDTGWLNAATVASIYQMPPKFIERGMPSFWMTYMAVADAEETAARATELGGKVELGPARDQGNSTFALIRDPLGAGFTVIDNPPPAGTSQGPGARAGHALFVSDVAAIAPFYSALFGWEFQPPQNGIYSVHHNGKPLFHCHEIPDPAVRGKEQYWTVLFSLSGARRKIEAQGCTTLAEFDIPEGRATLATDPQHAAFMTVEMGDG